MVEISEQEYKHLKENEERLNQIVENSVEWIWEVDTKGIYTFTNRIVENILGYSPEELVGKKHFYDFFLPDERDELKKTAFGIFKNKQSFRKFRNKNLRKDGRIVVLETSGTPVLNEKGGLLGYRGADADITELEVNEIRLKASEEKYKYIFENSLDLLITIDLMGNIKDLNSMAVKLFGFDRKEEVIGRNVREFLTLRDIPIALKSLALDFAGAISPSGDFEVKNKKGDIMIIDFAAGSVPIFEAGKKIGVMICGRDVSERKKAEQELKKKMQELEDFQSVAVDRELKMVQLEKEIDGLLKELGRPTRYDNI
ncbi:MAG: PAS domain-containing protein [Candidatus Margulisbacteria bacterium]|nr:PAS domain-containing protein [Candidatus Margulisiibacteriota bacterium]